MTQLQLIFHVELVQGICSDHLEALFEVPMPGARRVEYCVDQLKGCLLGAGTVKRCQLQKGRRRGACIHKWAFMSVEGIRHIKHAYDAIQHNASSSRAAIPQNC